MACGYLTYPKVDLGAKLAPKHDALLGWWKWVHYVKVNSLNSFKLMELIVLNSNIQSSEFQNQQLIFDPTYWHHDFFYKHIPKFIFRMRQALASSIHLAMHDTMVQILFLRPLTNIFESHPSALVTRATSLNNGIYDTNLLF